MKIIFFEDDETLCQMFATKFKEVKIDYKYFLSPPKEQRDLINLVLKENPDIILMSINMPVMDGFTATKILKSDNRTNKYKIVGFTSLSQQEYIENGLKLGMEVYLVKAKITPEKLIYMLRSLNSKFYTMKKFIKKYFAEIMFTLGAGLLSIPIANQYSYGIDVVTTFVAVVIIISSIFIFIHKNK